jgi:hypothetical protein
MLLAFVAAPAHADVLVLVRNSKEVVAENAGGFAVAAVALFGGTDKVVLKRAVESVESAFFSSGIASRASVVRYELPLRCVARAPAESADSGLLASWTSAPREVEFDLPQARRWALYVETTGLKSWLGDVSGRTTTTMLDAFEAQGVDVAICPLG